MGERTALHALLRPESVALVGASDDHRRPPGRPLHYLRRDGWQGRVYPVNPRRETVLGERAWPSLADLPEVPDHVFVMTGTDTVVDLVAQCGRLGVPVVTILAGGFAEAGPSGAARTEELLEVARRSGVRVLGPNAIGVVDTRSGLTLTANAAFVDGDLPSGRTFVASQSGSLIGALVSRGRARGIGFAALVSVGSESDLTLGEICAATLDDPEIDGYALFLETLSNAADLRAFALGAAERGKPVMAYKLGRSPAGADLAVTHTGALAGEDDVASAFLADCGIARVDTFEALLEGAVLAPRVPIRVRSGPPRVGVLTATGGGAAMVVDQLGVRGIDVPVPATATLDRLIDAVGYDVPAARIVDLTLRGTDATRMSAAIGVLREAGDLDLLVQVLGSSAASQPAVATEPAITAPLDGVPLATFVVPDAPDALARLAAAHVPAFRTPEACADAVAALLARRLPRPLPSLPPVAGGAPRVLDEAGSYGLLGRVGVPVVPSVVVEDEAASPTLPFPYPVAVKALVEGLAHKSDVGGVALDVPHAAGLVAAMQAMARDLAAAGIAERPRFVVQPMVQGVAEVLVGFRRDDHAGPLVLLAAGGILAELGNQRSIRLAPVDAGTAREMVAEVPIVAALVEGYRGRPAGDLDALADAVAALSRLALEPDVVEAEINPLLVTPDGVVAVDALARRT